MEDYKNLMNKITLGPSKSDKGKKLKKLKHESDEEKENTIELKGKKENDYVKIDGALFKYEGTAIHIIYDAETPWLRAKDIATILEYGDTTQAIRYNIDKKETRLYSSFEGRNFTALENGKRIQKNTIYISKDGMWDLIMESKAKGAKKFKKMGF
jgi:hypothetical protein